MNKLQLVSNVFSANTLGAGSLLPYNKPAVVFDFLDPSNSWIVPVESGIYQYQPGIPEIKNGGLTSDSNIIDGRQWLATPFNTATDTLTLIPSGSSTPETRAEYLSKLLLLARQANAYSTQSGEFRPVNICVNEPGDAGDRYSRVYDIQYAISGDMFTDPPNLQLTLTIVRYQFWTPVPLGTNPKVYTFQARGLNYADFAAPSELALFPDDIGSYTVNVTAGGSFTIESEGFTPDIGFGNTVIDYVSGVTITASITVRGAGNVLAPTQPSTDYIISFWMRSESASYDAVPLQAVVRRSSDGAAIFTSANFTVTVGAGWVKKTYTFTSDATAAGVYLGIAKNTSATSVSYDIYGISVKAAANPLDLTEYGNANPLLQNWREDTIYNIWTREDPADLKLNYIDIDASEVPGDAPALLMTCIDRNTTVAQALGLYMARRLDLLPDEAIYTNTFMAELSTISSPTGLTTTYTVDTTRGIDSSPQGNARNEYVIQVVAGAGAISSAVVAEWTLTSFAQGGKVAVFLRGDYTAGTPAEMPFFVRIVQPFAGISDNFQMDTQPRALANPASDVALNYMGSLDFTLYKNATRTAGGFGVTATNFMLQLVFGGRSAGSAATYRMTDIILMPYDEVLTTAPIGLGNTSLITRYGFLDNTGYFNQTSDGAAFSYRTLAQPDVYQPRELQGQTLTLEPNRNNRIYFLIGNFAFSPVDGTSNIQIRTRMNIIPQWRRLRSV